MNDFQKSLVGKLILAPMAGFTDQPLRRLCMEHGADYVVTEMISAKAICYKDKKTAVLAEFCPDELPLAIQIFGSDPAVMAQAAGQLSKGTYYGCVSECAPTAIDINMGCPVHKIVSNGEGSALLKDEGRVKEIVSAVKEASAVPVTVKIRTGIDEQHKNAVKIARAIEEAGADAICVHGRTREKMYAPGVDLQSIREVKEAVCIPVIGNGDIFSAEDALKMKDQTCCDSLMLARGTLGNPFLFEEIKAAFRNAEYTPPTLYTRGQTAVKHLRMMVERYGEERGIREARKHIAWYIKGAPGSSKIRDGINRSVSYDEIVQMIQNFTQNN